MVEDPGRDAVPAVDDFVTLPQPAPAHSHTCFDAEIPSASYHRLESELFLGFAEERAERSATGWAEAGRGSPDLTLTGCEIFMSRRQACRLLASHRTPRAASRL